MEEPPGRTEQNASNLVFPGSVTDGGPPSEFRFDNNDLLAAFDRARFTVSSDRPMRAWTQLRATVGTTERWGRTFYTDEQPRTIELRLEDFQPIGPNAAPKPPLDKVDSILFVVDTLNTLPGAKGTVTISDVAFVR